MQAALHISFTPSCVLKHTWYFSTEHFPHREATAYFYPLEAIQICFIYIEKIDRSEK